jgi:hypothetical protein
MRTSMKVPLGTLISRGGGGVVAAICSDGEGIGPKERAATWEVGYDLVVPSGPRNWTASLLRLMKTP